MRRSWGYAFIVLSVLIGFSALLLPTPEGVVFEQQEAPQPKKGSAKAPAKIKAGPRAAKGKPEAPPKDEPAPVMPTKNTVTGRVNP